MNRRNLLLAAVSALSLSAHAAAPDPLVGRWESLDANNGALRGSIVLQKEGGAVLAAEGQPELVGTWKSPGDGKLQFVMGEYGTADMTYRFDKGNLVLTYDNGNVQTFARRAAKKAPAKAKSKSSTTHKKS